MIDNSGKQTRTIAVLVDFFVENYQQGIREGIIQAATEAGVNLVFFAGGDLNSPQMHHRPRNILYDLVNTDHYDGILIYSATIGNFINCEELHGFISHYNSIPLVSIGVPFDNVSSVIVDNFVGMYNAIVHLITVHKRRNIAFIKGVEGNQEGETRYSAYVKALQDNGIAFDKKLVANGDFYYGSAEKALHEILDIRKMQIDAVAAANDIMAIDVINDLNKRNLHVPQKVSVIGFDNIEESRNIDPSLTTIAQPVIKIGRTAVSVLLSILDGGNPVQNIVLPPDSIVRASCGCFNFNFSKFSPGQSDVHPSQQSRWKKLIFDYLQKYAPGTSDEKLFKKLETILAHLHSEICQLKTENFITNLDGLIDLMSAYNIDTSHIVYIMMIFFEDIKTHHLQHPDMESCALLFSDYIKKIWIHVRNRQSKRHQSSQLLLRTLHATSIDFITAFSFERLHEILTRQLPELGFTFCHVYGYCSPDNGTEEAVCLFSMHASQNCDCSNSKPCKSKDILNGIILKTAQPESFTVMPLYYEDRNIGFFVVNTLDVSGIIYESLAIQLSGAIRAIQLLEQNKQYSESLEQKVIERTENLKKAKEELEVLNGRLTQLDRLKNDFIANITHDFRSPLTVILNVSDISIKYNTTVEPDHNRNYQVIYSASLRLKKTIDKLLELAKMDAQGMKVRIKKTKPVLFLKYILNYYDSSLNNSGIQLICEYPDHEIENLYTDQEKLEEIITNIMSNAIKFVASTDGVITVKLEDLENCIRISIKDNGIGISKDKLDIIFQRFEQAHSNRSVRYRGTGIGLSYAKQLMNYIKGRIRAESEGEGKGARFVIELDKGRNIFDESSFVEETHLEVNQSEIVNSVKLELDAKMQFAGIRERLGVLNAENEFDYKKGVILVVDDDEIMRNVVVQYLLHNGYKNFVLATDGTFGIEAVYRYSPDLIICDYNMPNMNGETFQNALLSNPSHKSIPLVFLSAIVDNTVIYNARQKGASNYLKKPIEEKELFFTVEVFLKSRFEFLKTLKLATNDELTGLANRQALLVSLSHEFSLRDLRSISLLFIDIGHLVRINENYGYHRGDELLVAIARELKKSIREYDIIGRYAGGKFLLILPGTEITEAEIAAQSLLTRIRGCSLAINGNLISTTASIGMSSLMYHEEYICKRLQISNLKDMYEISEPQTADWDAIKRKKQMIAGLMLEMAINASHEAKKTACKNCGFSSIHESDFPGGICGKCGSKDLIRGRNRIVVFSDND